MNYLESYTKGDVAKARRVSGVQCILLHSKRDVARMAPVAAGSLRQQQRRPVLLVEEITRHPAEQVLAYPALAIGAHHQNVGPRAGDRHAGRDPSSIAPEHTVPLAIFTRQAPPLRAGPRDPDHAFKIRTVILRRAASTAALRRQQWLDHSPVFVRNADPLAPGCLQKPALNQGPSPQSSFVHET